MHIATFSCDITPPDGHPLCGGWIESVRGVDDPLRALGVVLLGSGKPIVLCALDWCGLRNEAFRYWRQKLAEAAHTNPENVSLHCVHQHNTPFADLEAEKLIAKAGASKSLDLDYYYDCVKRCSEALRASLIKAVKFTHIGTGCAEVIDVASNRRILGPDGKVKFTRTSATTVAEIRDADQGIVDPNLRTLSFWDRDIPIAALSFYACHPMSYYGDGRVSADFCGLARQIMQEKHPNIFQVYFNGAGGNITAGKYNDGAKKQRIILRDRIYTAINKAWTNTKLRSVDRLEWRTSEVRLTARKEPSFNAENSRTVLADSKAPPARRNNSAFQLAWLKRIDTPIELGCLDFGCDVMFLDLPGEPFVEYQIAAQKMRPDSTIMVAAYGDDGPGYIPTAVAYQEGGYEPSVSLVGPESEQLILNTMRRLLKAVHSKGNDQ